MTFNQKLLPYAKLMRLDRPIGNYLLLWPTLWALWLASNGIPEISLLFIFVTGVFIMRALGSAINDIIDKDIDIHVARTITRPLANGELTMKQAMCCISLLSVIALVLVMQLNFLTQVIAMIAALTIVIYPFTKRFFSCPQCMLGITWSMSILMAFSASQNTLPSLSFLVYFTHLLLTIAYDTMYALCDKNDDLKIGVHSTAIWFGESVTTIIGFLQFSVLIFLVTIGQVAQLSYSYYFSLTIVAMLFGYQQWLIQDSQFDDCLKAFKTSHLIGLVIFLGIFFSLK